MDTLDNTIDPVKAEKARIFRERMAKAAADRAAAGIENTPYEYLNPMERARKHPGSLKMAIAAKCWDCQGQDSDPHPKWRIGNCIAPDCPLWPHRPHQKTYGQPIPASLRTSFDATADNTPEEPDNDD